MTSQFALKSGQRYGEDAWSRKVPPSVSGPLVSVEFLTSPLSLWPVRGTAVGRKRIGIMQSVLIRKRAAATNGASYVRPVIYQLIAANSRSVIDNNCTRRGSTLDWKEIEGIESVNFFDRQIHLHINFQLS